ncbi:hypothetical protein OM076_41485, partial [Solirubrobacter ginsenosidimutans]
MGATKAGPAASAAAAERPQGETSGESAAAGTRPAAARGEKRVWDAPRGVRNDTTGAAPRGETARNDTTGAPPRGETARNDTTGAPPRGETARNDTTGAPPRGETA